MSMAKKGAVSGGPVLAAFALSCLLIPPRAFGAVGCDLNDPDRDVARLFPGSTGYRTSYESVQKRGGDELLKKIEARLGDKFHGLYETADVPYTIYEILSGKDTIGYIHGVNQKGQFGGIQVFVALDMEGTVKAFYVQKMTSRWAAGFRAAEFARQFVGLSHATFDYDPATGRTGGKAAGIVNPAPEGQADFSAVMRALKKNLILMDVFVFSARKEAP